MNIDLNQLTIDMFNYARPGDINICAAISNKEIKKKLYYLGDLDPKNTLDLKHKSWLKTTFNISNKDIKTRYVKTLRLEKILDKHNFKEIDLSGFFEFSENEPVLLSWFQENCFIALTKTQGSLFF